MWKEAPTVEQSKNGAPQGSTAKTITEDDLNAIVERLNATRDILRENQELRSVLFRRETESKELRARNSELEEIVRKFAPILLNAATTMELAARQNS